MTGAQWHPGNVENKDGLNSKHVPSIYLLILLLKRMEEEWTDFTQRMCQESNERFSY